MAREVLREDSLPIIALAHLLEGLAIKFIQNANNVKVKARSALLKIKRKTLKKHFVSIKFAL